MVCFLDLAQIREGVGVRLLKIGDTKNASGKCDRFTFLLRKRKV